MSIESAWHAFTEKLAHIRHHADPAMHKDLDELAEHATAVKAAADTVVTKAIATAVPVAEEAAVKAVEAEIKP